MPRRRSVRDAPSSPTALVASATRYSGKSPRIYHPKQDWQRECYRHYAICGEARFAAKFFGHAVSRAILYAGTMTPSGPEPDTGQAQAALDDLFDGEAGQTQMLDAMGVHLTIAGECYLVGRHTDPAEDQPAEDTWEIVSIVEMEVSGSTWTINYGNGSPPINLTDNDVVIRIWLSSPARQVEADSPFRSLLPILGEIEWLTRHIFSQITSRLTGAGILFLPQGMTFPPPPGQDGKETQAVNEAEAFMVTLADNMLTPIEDPSSAAAQIPIVVTIPEGVDIPNLLTFWSDLDANSMSLRSEAIRRFALGMDLPPEQVLGMSSNSGSGGGTSNGVSHWGAWQIEEATIKLHIEPMLDVICNALTMGYLRPLVDGDTMVFYDTSALRLRPDRSKEAIELYDRGLLSPKAVLRETGFDESDLPDANEFRTWLTVKVASGSATPEQVGAALIALGVDLGLPPTEIGSRPREAQSPPSLEKHPNKPRTPAESALLAACEALVFRALERAGNRLRQAGARPPNVPSYETHLFVRANGNAELILNDAWSCAPQVLTGIAEPETVIPVLNSYCKALITEGSAHSRDRLADWLRLAEVDA